VQRAPAGPARDGLVVLALEQIVQQAAQDVRVDREDPPEDVVILQVGEDHAPDLLALVARRKPGAPSAEARRGLLDPGAGVELVAKPFVWDAPR
jgi:hypothetical protein